MTIGRWMSIAENDRDKRHRREWMSSAQTRKAIPVPDPQIGVTYGDFEQGRLGGCCAADHPLMESHHRGSISEMLE